MFELLDIHSVRQNALISYIILLYFEDDMVVHLYCSAYNGDATYK